ncbi:MAG: tRNA (adenosine(37)-N6)-threonylcarbamoyltransferase complex transferase subunit TsaD [Rhodospirillaceae bacterium]|jgi:N6-L-threonylcarbamoyladenine synthase|nr:tRNA (adenosine(37)-N6)-threonylcarbamoyltransferase complex transferase subunit TsaD [Rhodospirillaceae bacterium]
MIVLGIESSCDETAAAVVTDGRTPDSHADRRIGDRILADLVAAQLEDHRPYGGVVPEVAARAHLDRLDRLVGQAMRQAGIGFGEIDAVAATGGPGLIGGVIVGVMTGKAIALVHNKPFLAVNHLEGHALTARLTDDCPFPYLLLLVSGGHCQLLVVEGVGRYRRLGSTIDDAAGEAFDKAAKLLGLGYPGGPMIERAASRATKPVQDLPRPMKGRAELNFSFSGLKTALRHKAAEMAPLDDAKRADLAAGFQLAVVESLLDRTRRAVKAARDAYPDLTALVVAGGVAANAALRTELESCAAAAGLRFVAPPQRLCTDNAAMIAWAGLERFRLGERDSLDFAPRPRWPLDENAPKLTGAGVKA